MTLAIFDLDNTLLGGDSDHLWGTFLAEKGLVSQTEYDRKNDYFFEQYKQGTLDMQAYLAFALQFLGRYPRVQLDAWLAEFIECKIAPIMQPKAQALVDKHRQQGHTLMIITATNRFLTTPIAARLGVAHLLATEVEEDAQGGFTGRSFDIPCFQQGKVTRLQRWLEENQADLTGSWFYSDSLNDIPLLEMVDNPVAVDPDASLLKVAQQRHWPVISLRNHG
ncbi:HAD-superfamily subfamily IB hydrolase, TIGR01490 [Magnetococcus marinus MC-1]|uniref:Histidinol-phosphatase n=1 Tax=Magnetococcus marinus (strain ATCC BAA-1437 / JCM 17883 / MC-1) TaxID=156889 RepID=A0LBS7_MAGMM|nr:HAD family hydrolase [Magnetococcus marinus]ABK45420.1 HAD-superfamily subfamily IB hydrolase, TIGR01490 [Magnetococcus marinus MC-1]